MNPAQRTLADRAIHFFDELDEKQSQKLSDISLEDVDQKVREVREEAKALDRK